MSKKLYESFESLVNGDTERADQLMHEFIVEQSKSIYRELNEAEFGFGDAEMDDASVAGDQTEDFISDIEANEQDIQNDELSAGKLADETDETDADETDADDKIEELSGKIDELMQKFNDLIDAEMDEPHHADDNLEKVEFEDETQGLEDEEFDDSEYVKEAYAQVSLEKPAEGKFAGTGKNSKTGATQTQSPLSSAPSKTDGGKGQPVKFAGGDEKGSKAPAVKSMPAKNEDVKYKQVAPGASDVEGEYVGTGKNTPGAKVVNKDSLLSKPVKKG